MRIDVQSLAQPFAHSKFSINISYWDLVLRTNFFFFFFNKGEREERRHCVSTAGKESIEWKK